MGVFIRSCLFLMLALNFGAMRSFAQDCRALIDASAGDPSRVDERCFLITSVRVDQTDIGQPRSLTNSRLGESSSLSLAQQGGGGTPIPGGQVPAIIAAADKITLIGQRIWNFIKDNEPTDEVSAVGADALPEGLKSPSQLIGWSYPQIKQFRVVYTNLYGIDVVDFTYQVVYTYGGSIQGKKGRYLTNVQVRPGKLKVLWGFRFDFAGGATKAINMGTKQDPVAAIEMMARWRVHSVLVTLASTESFFIKGNGSFERISTGDDGMLP